MTLNNMRKSKNVCSHSPGTCIAETISKKGKALKRLTLVYKKTTSDEFIDYLKPNLDFFVKHNFVARWEDKQFRECLKSFPQDSGVSIVDFAENYTFVV